MAFGVIATMLFVTNFPVYIIAFFGVFAYLLWKTFANPAGYGVRDVFEFYLAANEKISDTGRRWFGFEIQEELARGERILQKMQSAPPLVYFALGALYHKIGDHKSAVDHLSYVLENEFSGEEHYAFATPELKSYVKILRKIEREPAQAPLTSAAIKGLESARRNRGKAMLEESRAAVLAEQRKNPESLPTSFETTGSYVSNNESDFSSIPSTILDVSALEETRGTDSKQTASQNNNPSAKNGSHRRKNKPEDAFANRKPITELLHDIYDKRP